MLTNKEAFDELLSKYKSNNMGLKVLSGLNSENPEKKVLFRDLRKYLEMFSESWHYKRSSKYAVSQVFGYITDKNAIHIARTYAGYKDNFIARTFGPKVISHQQLVEMKILSANISKDRKILIRELTN